MFEARVEIFSNSGGYFIKIFRKVMKTSMATNNVTIWRTNIKPHFINMQYRFNIKLII